MVLEDAYEAEAAATAVGSKPKPRLNKAKFLDRRASRLASAAAQGRRHAMRLRQSFLDKTKARQQGLRVQPGAQNNPL